SLFFSLLICSSIGLMEKYAYSKLAYILLPVFLVGHGSLKFIDHAKNIISGKMTFLRLLQDHPYFVDFNNNGRFGYNGNMFSIFYFLEERQLIFACLVLLLFIYILLNVNKFDKKFVIFLGFLFGLFLQWHLFISVIFMVVGINYALLTLFLKKKKAGDNVFIFVLIVVLILLLHAGLLKIYANSNQNFNHQFLNQFPKIDFNFPTLLPTYPFSFLNVIIYYFYAYGLRIFLYLFAYLYAFRKKKNIFILLLSFIPIFILINTVWLSPISVYENHKWLKPFNLVMDLFSLSLFLKWILSWRFFFNKAMVLVILFFLTTISGIFSFLNFFLQKPNELYADLNNYNYKKILKTSPKSVFLTDDNAHYVLLAGRKSYLSEYHELGFNTVYRQIIKDKVSNLINVQEICYYLREKKLNKQINYVVFEDKNIFVNLKEDCLY
ncbi:MAG: hypothetical protein ACD_12C00501G0001, partial [uncultured bacterium]